MSHIECRLNQRFWRSKKLYKLLKNGGEGGGAGVLDKIKKTAYFPNRKVSVWTANNVAYHSHIEKSNKR